MFVTVSTFAGTGEDGIKDGPVETATLARPTAIAIGPNGVVYVVETVRNGIRKIEAGIVSTLASRTKGYRDGPLSEALFNEPGGVASDHAGNLYVADTLNHRIRKIDTAGNVTTVAGPAGSGPLQGWADGPLDGVLFNYPNGIAIDPADTTLYVSELHRIRGVPTGGLSGPNIVYTVAAVGIAGFADGPPTLAQFDQPLDLT
jgi:DNA-binding beta-propeller fold protein YncE